MTIKNFPLFMVDILNIFINFVNKKKGRYDYQNH